MDIMSIVVDKTRLCACKLKYLLLWLVNLQSFLVYFLTKLGWSGSGKRNILLGWPFCCSLGVFRIFLLDQNFQFLFGNGDESLSHIFRSLTALHG